MKTGAHYRYLGSYSNEDLFYQFWNSAFLCYEKPKPEKTFANIKLLSLEKYTHRIFLVEGHFHGTIRFLLMPLNIPTEEKVDKDFAIKVELCRDGRLEPFRAESMYPLLERAQNNIDFEEIEPIEIDKEVFTKKLEWFLRLLPSVGSSKICFDGVGFDGEFSIIKVTAFDEMAVKLNFIKNGSKGYAYLSYFDYENEPGKIVPNKGDYDHGFFKKRKFPKVLEANKQYFFELITKLDSSDKGGV